MRLRAFVRAVTGNTKHFIGTIVDDEPVPVRQIPPAHYVEIEPDGNHAFLHHFDADGNELADSWHESVEEAKRQAAFEYCIGEDDWREVV